MQNVSIIISLMEPVGVLKQRFRQNLSMCIMHNRNVDTRVNMMDYDCAEYITMLLGEIFNNPTNTENRNNVSQSTQLLIRDGMDANFALTVAGEIFPLIVDAISTFVPNAKFNESDGYRYSFCNDCDLFVSPPYRENIERMNDEHDRIWGDN